MMRIFLWRTLALAALMLALVGVVVPGLPTTPFLLVAAWSGFRAWPALERRLLDHPHAGPVIVDWRERGAVPRAGKWAAVLMMGTSLAIMFAMGVAPVPLSLAALVMLALGSWLWSRPDA